jgi:hypothetical protein
VHWAVGLNGIITVAIAVWLVLSIELWLVGRNLKRESRAQATHDYKMKREAADRAALENYKHDQFSHNEAVRHLKMIQKQFADAQDDEALRRLHPPGFLPTHTVGKILGWGLPRQTSVYGASAGDTVFGSVIGDVTYAGYPYISGRHHDVARHPFPSPVIKGYFRATDLIQWIEGMLSELRLYAPEPPAPVVAETASRRRRFEKVLEWLR